MATPIRAKSDWRTLILHRILERNKHESNCFKAIYDSQNKLYTNLEVVKTQSLQLQIQVERLKQEKLDLEVTLETGGGGGASSGKTQALEQKMFRLQEELTNMLRKKGENTQQLVDQTTQLADKEKDIQAKDARLQETEIRVNAYEMEMENMGKAILDLQKANETLKDEHTTLQLLYVRTEEKLNAYQMENAELIARWMTAKAEDALHMNKENETFQKRKQEKMKKQLEEAAEETHVDPIRNSPHVANDLGALGGFAGGNSNICVSAMVPQKAVCTIDAHDGDVNAVKFSPSGRLFATGGADRKLKLWEFQNVSANCQVQGMCVGSNAAVMCLDYDSTEQFILGSSSDYATRVWGITDLRLRHTLTGHSGKVLAAKFLGETNKVVSGSHDRTLKLWDLRSKACSRTLFAMSSCNDLVTSDGAGTNIISGHFDRRIRFWDTRSEHRANEIQLPGKVTSLQLSEDRQYLLACSRDDSLKLIDLRMNQVSQTFCADSFKVVLDYTRAALSPDGVYAAVGSQDGSICVWNVQTGNLETTVKEHNSTVVAVAWHPNGRQMLSCDRSKKVIMWSAF